VGRHDNFFALGGHSLLAMRMVNLVIQKGFALTLSQLYRNPILADLVEQMTSDGQRPAKNRAIPVRTSGDERPLFFVPTGLGDHSYAFELARDLKPTLPIYVLLWPTAEHTHDLTIETMALDMVSMLRHVQPRGPYRLAGYSSGGMLAYAMADQLLNLGEEVSFVGLIDTHLLDETLQQPAIMAEHMMLEWMESAGFTNHALSLRDIYDELPLDLLIQERRRLNLALPSELRGILDDRLQSTQGEAAFWKQIARFTNALWTYRTPRLPLAVHQFYAQKHEDSFEDVLTLRQPARGWERILPSTSINTYPIPGSHLSMMSEPACRAILGAHISHVLMSVQNGVNP
jgi:thioesterase domain-containing protein/aryl carrier-like protein